MRQFFISDLHIATENPHVLASCLHLLEKEKNNFDELYILGDLFDFWFGDDAAPPSLKPLVNALKTLADSGKTLFFMQGNRDFLVGETFCKQIGCTLLHDPFVINFCGSPALLMHGDLLCTDDVEYMKFREFVRDPDRQRQYLAMPIAARIEQARAIQIETKQKSQTKSAEIMDANDAAINQYFHEYKVNRIIHGHTHRPAVHHLQIDDHPVQRIVLGDWRDTPSYLISGPDGFALNDSRVPLRQYSARLS